MAKSWGDPSKAMKMRDTIERIVRSVIAKERPETFLGEVVDYNIFTMTGHVKTITMTDDDPPLLFSFNMHLQPDAARDVQNGFSGTIIEVEGKPGNYRLKRVMRGGYRISYPRLINPRVQGGLFDSVEAHSEWMVTHLSAPAGNTETVHLGEWNNTGLTLWSGGMAIAEVDIFSELFTSQLTSYRLQLPRDNEGGGWRVAAPMQDSGNTNGEDWQLEVNTSVVDGFQLRVRRIRPGNNATAGPIVKVKVIGQRYDYDQTLRNLIETTTRPTEFFGRRWLGREDFDIVSGGLWGDHFKHAVEVRAQNGLVPPSSLTWDNVNLGWTGAWFVLGIGNSDLSSAGHMRIQMPANGTVIPVYGTSVVSSVTVASGKINLNSVGNGAALYYEPQFFGDARSTVPRRCQQS